MKIELDEQKRRDAIASLQRYFEANMPEPIGELPAGQLLNFILEEIGPVAYNRGVVDTKDRLQGRLEDIESELYVDEFQYWSKQGGVRRGRR